MGRIHTASVATVQSVALPGFDGALIEVETDIKAGLPSLQIVGMGNKAIDEARQRVRSAITNSLLEFPARKVTVNLAPAELPKDGTHLDLPIALSILVASGQLKPPEVSGAVFAGELALDGYIRPVRGAVGIAETARKAGAHTVFVPHHNVQQARLVKGITIIGVTNLKELFLHLRNITKITEKPTHSMGLRAPKPSVAPLASPPAPLYPTFDDIIGHDFAKRALTIAAAGRHNILLNGPPGTGKTLLAKTLVGLLPPLVEDEILEVTKLHSLAQDGTSGIITTPPLRAPHHSVTLTALIGGGLRPRPGDISLAHKGVLFLDELPEYPRAILEALRQPLEDRTISLSRLYGRITYPADILLVATMNSCPCGYLGDAQKSCTCTALQITGYQKRVSGPLLDRIDLRLSVSKVDSEHFFASKPMNNQQHITVVKQINKARAMQHKRYNRSDIYNAYASLDDAKALFDLTAEAQQLVKNAANRLDLSSRATLRVLRVARTIADLDGSHRLEARHVAEALQFR